MYIFILRGAQDSGGLPDPAQQPLRSCQGACLCPRCAVCSCSFLTFLPSQNSSPTRRQLKGLLNPGFFKGEEVSDGVYVCVWCVCGFSALFCFVFSVLRSCTIAQGGSNKQSACISFQSARLTWCLSPNLSWFYLLKGFSGYGADP